MSCGIDPREEDANGGSVVAVVSEISLSGGVHCQCRSRRAAAARRIRPRVQIRLWSVFLTRCAHLRTLVDMPDDQHTQDDDEVQFLYEQQCVTWASIIDWPALELTCARRASLPCQLCELNLAKMTPKERTEHYDEHFSESSQGQNALWVALLTAHYSPPSNSWTV